MKLASGQQWAHFIQIQSEIYILFPAIAMQSTEFLKAMHKIPERAELKLMFQSFGEQAYGEWRCGMSDQKHL